MTRNPWKENPPLTGNPRYDQPCVVVDAEGVPCGAMPSKQFLNWRGCINHTPAAMNGREEPTAILARVRKQVEAERAEKAAAAGRVVEVDASEVPEVLRPLVLVENPVNPIDVTDLPPADRARALGSARLERKARTEAAIAEARAAARAARGVA